MFADRRRLALIALTIVMVAVVAWWQGRPEPSTSVAAAPLRSSRAKPEPVAGPVKPLRLEALAAERGEPSRTNRNPFRFQQRVAAPAPRPVAPPPPTAEMTRPVPTAPPGPPPAPPISLKFIALVERANGVKWAVLSDGKTTMYGKDGDTIDGRYRIVKIGEESVEVTHLDGRGRQVIRLTGQ